MTAYNEERAELHEALRAFAASARFNFLKSLQVGPLLGEDAKSLGAISAVTFEQLVASVDNHASALHQLNGAQERLLATVLLALSEAEPAEPDEQGFASSDDAAEEGMAEGSSNTTFNSVQCELELRERISKLKAHSDLSSIKGATVGSFWGADLPRAPFEESLTIQQLLGLDLGVLAKKRSMTSLRMRALAQALEHALHSLEGTPSRPMVEAPIEVKHSPETNRKKSTKHKWIGQYNECSPRDMAVIESVISASSDDAQRTDVLFEALHHFCSVFSAEDLLLILKEPALPAQTQRKLLAWAHSVSLREYVPLVRMALQGPGTHIAKIADLLRGADAPAAVYGIAATLILRGLGAQQVSVAGTVCPEVWTSNPALMDLIVAQAKALKRGGFSQALAAVCPEMDPFLHQWLQRIVPSPKGGKKRLKRR